MSSDAAVNGQLVGSSGGPQQVHAPALLASLSSLSAGVPQRPPGVVLLWFRRDLRVADNPALIAALQTGAVVVRACVLCPRCSQASCIVAGMLLIAMYILCMRCIGPM